MLPPETHGWLARETRKRFTTEWKTWKNRNFAVIFNRPSAAANRRRRFPEVQERKPAEEDKNTTTRNKMSGAMESAGTGDGR